MVLVGNPRWAEEVGTRPYPGHPSKPEPDILVGPVTTKDPFFDGLETKWLFKLYKAIQNPVYEQIATMNSNLDNVEDPHNMLHNFVGDSHTKKNSRLTAVIWKMRVFPAGTQSFGSITNVERQQCAWFKIYTVPTILRSNPLEKINNIDVIDFEMYPFPKKEVLENPNVEEAYALLPFRRSPEDNADPLITPISTARLAGGQ